MAHLRGWSDGTATSSAPARLRYRPLEGMHLFIPAGAGGGDGIIVPTGTQLIPDFGGRNYEGEIAFTPKYDDSRMVLRGDPLPPYSGDTAYTGGVKIDVLLQARGLCVMTSTSASLIRVFDLLHDEFVCAPEAAAGKLPIFRIEEPRSYSIQQRADLLYAPVYSLVGWATRDSLKLGPRLIPPPKPLPSLDVLAATPVLESDSVFERTGEVMPPGPKWSRSERGASRLVPAGDLDDEIPF
jgi:hypothetical protein